MRRDFIIKDKPGTPVFPKSIINCFDGMNLASIISKISDASSSNKYYVNIYPDADTNDINTVQIPEGVFLLFPVTPVSLPGLRLSAYSTFSRRVLSGINFSDPEYDSMDPSDTPRFTPELAGIDFSYSDIRNSDFSTANLYRSAFDFCDIRNSIFRYANLANASFECSNIQRTYFDFSDLTGVGFSDADLTRVNFHSANLTDVLLLGADISKAEFTGAILTNAFLPENANTKELFKALVGGYDAVTTIWTDGLPIG